MPANNALKRSLEDRVIAKIVIGPGCWAWNGCRVSGGYGSIKVNGRMIGAHRVVWELANLQSADGLHIRHTCDNPWCVKPDHLVSGSASDNMKDMYRRRRHFKVLTDADVERIREANLFGAKQIDLANIYGLHDGHMSKIIRKRLFK